MPSQDRNRLDKLREAARALEWDDDPGRFRERAGRLVRHRPVEKPE